MSLSFMELFLGLSSRMESTVFSRNFRIEQCSDVHCGGILDCKSAMAFNFAFPLMCLIFIGVLLTFVKMLDILALAENFPLLISLIASKTGLLSVSIIKGLLLSLTMLYSFSIPAARPKLSISHGHHFIHLFGSLTECIRTGSFFLLLVRKVCAQDPALKRRFEE